MSSPSFEDPIAQGGDAANRDLKDATVEARAAEARELPPEIATSEPRTLSEALALAGPKPPDDEPNSGKKIAYATRLSGFIAKVISNGLRAKDRKLFEHLRAGEEEIGSGTSASKKIDVLLATDREGMKLNVSLKTQSFRDFQKGKVKTTKSYCHNLTRIIDQELQLEAKKSHQIFPHALLIAVIVFPVEAWFDANPKRIPNTLRDSDCSSAAEFAQRLRAFSGRENLRDSDQEARFEAVFIAAHGLPQLPESQRPTEFTEDVAFFSVTDGIPHNGLPKKLITFDGFLEAVRRAHNQRWHARREWED
jgi:hypothetical protein